MEFTNRYIWSEVDPPQPQVSPRNHKQSTYIVATYLYGMHCFLKRIICKVRAYGMAIEYYNLHYRHITID